ncbi:MAG: hypothetical protein ACXVB5_20800 [Isosphaeraceae bacterium]
MPWSMKCPSRVVAVLALALGIVPARVGLGQTSPYTDPVPRIAQTPQTPTTPTTREPVGHPVTPGAVPVPPGPTPAPPPTEATEVMREALEPGFGGTQFAALGGAGAAVAYNQQIGGLGGYIDSAVPRNNIRVRYDDAYGMNRPDRAEYYYPQCGCFFVGNSVGLARGTRAAALAAVLVVMPLMPPLTQLVVTIAVHTRRAGLMLWL